MMTDLIQRLRFFQTLDIEAREICDEAADALRRKDAEIERLEDRIEELERQINAAVEAACETQPSWEWRCWSIMNALGQDFPKPATRYGEEQARIEELEQRNAKLEKVRKAVTGIKWRSIDKDNMEFATSCFVVDRIREALADTESSDDQR